MRAQAWTEVAQELDRREAYRLAMHALLRGKELLRQREGPLLGEAESVLQHLVTLTESLTADHDLRWQQEGSELPSARTAELTSFPRSSTTLLEQVLSCFFQSLPLNPDSVCFLTLERTCRGYAEDLRAWRILRERLVSPWLDIRYEDTVADLERGARRALGFLGLPWEESVPSYRERLRTRAVGSPQL